MFRSFFHPEDAYEAAQKKANQGWKETQGYERPFWQAGIDQTGRLTGAEDKLLDPAALESEWAKGYETSPYARQQLAENQTQGLEGASSMGLMGSSAALGNIQQGAGNIVSKDREQYMKDLMEKYMAGLGIGKDIYGTGANMGATLGGQAQEHGRDIAGLEYGRQAAPGKLFGQIAGGAFNALVPGAGNASTGGTQQNRYNPY